VERISQEWKGNAQKEEGNVTRSKEGGRSRRGGKKSIKKLKLRISAKLIRAFPRINLQAGPCHNPSIRSYQTTKHITRRNGGEKKQVVKTGCRRKKKDKE